MTMHRFAVVALVSVLGACGDSGGDTGADDDGGTTQGTSATSAATMTTTMTTAGESTTTGGNFECDANTDFALGDGVELGAMSVEAIRREINGDIQYVIAVHGDDAGTNELDITFNDVPVQDMEYQATALMQFGQPIVALLPPLTDTMDFQMGTVTYTMVGTAEGDVLSADFHLEFMRGTIEGCVRQNLVIETM